MELNKGCPAGLHVISPSLTRIGMSRESSAHCLLPFSSQQPASRRFCLSTQSPAQTEFAEQSCLKFDT